MRPKPLANIRIIDLTRLLPGPMCTLHLADMGADVIKIEDPKVGDYARAAAGPDRSPSAYFLCANRNKRGFQLNLGLPGGREVFLDLAKDADVIVESFRPGVVARLGIDYETIKAINPRIVYCSITGYGQTGPYRNRAGHDLNYCAYAGITDQIGHKGGPPAIPNIQFADLAGGALSAAMGILAALVDVGRAGAGRYIDVSMTDCALVNAVVPLIGYLDSGRVAPRGADLLSGALPCYGVYETLDGRYMAIAAPEEKFWRAFCEAVEHPELISARMAMGREGKEARDRLAEIFRAHPMSWWIGKLEGVDCCVSPVLDLQESMENEHFEARGMFVGTDRYFDNEGDNGGAREEMTQFAFPLKISDFEFGVTRPAPRRGEHTTEILAELGYSDDRIQTLARDGVI
uniref:Crotonobetainyl-CoA:carnitine CoA-transferase CaiB n=1 Tax=Candidatus Kentrum sp. SD TaxID=2126332 RepID=A0A450Y598_9GAMM|nr:MAG: Crotonobetainyl-CoA:carnitine CoA-transferase CaiB [Candidatus Kentron sp. SD]VFK40235.1 MAG: Crotonobetainyl-CoA:carnitine CoA-transferase CaiB [Candidatus Kentron sp. SD]